MIAQPIQTLHNVRRYNYTKTGWQLKKEGTLHIVHVIMKTQKEKNSGNSCCLRKLSASFPSNDKCVVSVFKNFFRVVIMTSLKLCL